jgi:hypothetical protein
MEQKVRILGNPVQDADPSTRSGQTVGNHGTVPKIDASLVRAQLERILASAPFRNSKRYPALLRYVVEQQLNGTAADLKERTIGIDVFGRDPSYDPGADPVVRISAGEVRKRLAQYYQEADISQLRIELPLGSYHPEFVLPPPASIAPEQAALSSPVAIPSDIGVRGNVRRRRTTAVVATFLTLAILIGSVILYRLAGRPTALDLFWRPVIAQNHSVLLCMGRGLQPAANPASSSRPVDPNQSYVAWWDAETMAEVAGLLQSKGASLHFLRESEATFSDFQQSPAVLIGAFNDQWTLELMSHMRYTFQKTGNVQWIMDRDRPNFQDWKVDLGKSDAQGNLDVHQDYAILSRVANPRTGFITVTVAGLWGYGTLAAGRFLTDASYLEEFSKRNAFPLNKDNVQIVLATEVIQGKSGPPRVVAATSW